MMKKKKMVNQYIILRKDAPTVTGGPVSPAKLAVMTAHASSWFLFNYAPLASRLLQDHVSYLDDETLKTSYKVCNDLTSWAQNNFTKILLGAKTKDFYKLPMKFKEAGLRENRDFFIIHDLCNTELLPDEGNTTCTIAIGLRPMEEEIVKPLVKRIQIYK